MLLGVFKLEPGCFHGAIEDGVSNHEPGVSNLEAGVSNIETRVSNLEGVVCNHISKLPQSYIKVSFSVGRVFADHSTTP